MNLKPWMSEQSSKNERGEKVNPPPLSYNNKTNYIASGIQILPDFLGQGSVYSKRQKLY